MHRIAWVARGRVRMLAGISRTRRSHSAVERQGRYLVAHDPEADLALGCGRVACAFACRPIGVPGAAVR